MAASSRSGCHLWERKPTALTICLSYLRTWLAEKVANTLRRTTRRPVYRPMSGISSVACCLLLEACTNCIWINIPQRRQKLSLPPCLGTSFCSYEETKCIWQRGEEKQCKHMSISSRLACSISQMLHQWTYPRDNKHSGHRVSNNIPESAGSR
jgi:hypothetical protein